MPIYVYQCAKCHHRFEHLQKIKDPLLKECPKCGELKLKKCVVPASFHLKGTGWYATDYKTKAQEHKTTEIKTTEETKKEKK